MKKLVRGRAGKWLPASSPLTRPRRAAPVCCTGFDFAASIDQAKSVTYILRNLFAKCSVGMAIYGYARVSTQGQNLAAQIETLKEAGASAIYREKVSGVRANRPELANQVDAGRPGDRNQARQARPFDP